MGHWNLEGVHEAAILRPMKGGLTRNLPHCFEEHKEVRIVLDCTKAKIEKSHSATCRSFTYSHYKVGHTANVLIGVPPGGLVTLLSKGFGGRESDKACVEKPGVLDKLTSFQDDVMVDKGFYMDDMWLGLGVVPPPFLRSQGQFSATES